MHLNLSAFTVTCELRSGNGDTSTVANVVAAANADLARQLGEHIGRAAASDQWTFDPQTVQVTQGVSDADLSATTPLLAAVEQEMAHSLHLQRILTALVTRYGPLALTAAEIDAAAPNSLAQVVSGRRPDTMWWVLPHHMHVPHIVSKLPDLPETGMVDGPDLHLHPGREVLVSTDAGQPAQMTPSRWAWRTIVQIEPHPSGPAWLLLHTEHGTQAIIAAGMYSVRNPRPAPHQPADPEEESRG